MGSFCCSVLPKPPESASVARCGPNRAFDFVTQSVRTSLRSNRERLVIVGTCVMGRCGGPIPGESCAFQHTSILVRPHQKRRKTAFFGGAAGYRPRVRCAYCTPQFIAIAGRNRHSLYRNSPVNVKYSSPSLLGEGDHP